MADLLGTLGVFLILLAYFLNVNQKLSQQDRRYIWLNLTGALLACISSILIKSIPFTVLEGTWALVSIFALFKTPRANAD